VADFGVADAEREEEASEAEGVAWVGRSPAQGPWVNVFVLLARQQPLIKLGFLAISRSVPNAEHPW